MSNSKGSALIFTLMVILILTVLGVSILELSLTEFKISASYGNDVLSRYAAEAGLDILKSEFNTNLLTALKNNAQRIIDNNYDMEKGTYKVSMDQLYSLIFNDTKNYLYSYVFNKYLNEGNVALGNTGQIYKISSIAFTLDEKMQYIIHVETVGIYRNIKSYGHADLILNLQATGNPITISNWTIDNIPPSN
ncbi:PilX-like protein [Thermoanaerobacterium thermosaccharolyticum]|uniref:PilX-like protein n=1 Tax=Thermoanaerobacterium thermosaccharolyticum TaxID=1517 RepID=A0A223I362_THETR|nr:pilus assembly PilX N-terminal domain-containing protein [Thermoanaerobacterium thermosaccharolyticum]AST59161.1 PilX-like protein [Thermoanaerobacterium thermosaccharolyticum]